MRLNHFSVGVAVLLLVVGGGMAGTVFPSSTGGTAVAQQDGDTDTVTCDYTELYDRSVDSVVAVQTGSGLGAGFVYRVAEDDSTGYVVTNAHVVRGAESVIVQFGREDHRPGTVIGRDRFTDLAVLRVNRTPEFADPLPVAESMPDHGRKVAALGSPFGLEQTITHGIVSGLNRSMPTQFGFAVPDVVQTDAPINPGNSGGPLITCDGTVVGVNTAGISASRGENIGFAVSSRVVARVVPELIETGEYEHAYLGVRTTPLTPQLVAANELNETGGLYVHEVTETGPASDVLQGTTGTAIVDGTPVPTGGDVIVAIDGRSITSGEQLSSYLLTETRPGDEVALTVVRDGDRRQVTVTLGEQPEPTVP